MRASGFWCAPMPKHLIWPGWLLFLALFALAVLNDSAIVRFAGLRLDALFWLIAPFIAFVGANVAHFSARYMDGDADAGRFWWRLAALLLTALLLVAADHVGCFIAAWTAPPPPPPPPWPGGWRTSSATDTARLLRAPRAVSRVAG